MLYLVAEDWFFASHFLGFAQAARECGFDVVVATNVGEESERLANLGLRTVPMSSERGSLSLLKNGSYFARVLKVLIAEQPDAVHCISLWPAVIGGLAAKLTGVQEVILEPTGLGILWLKGGLSTVLARSIVRFLFSSCFRGGVRFVFENHQDPLDLGLDPNNQQITFVAAAGVDENQIVPSPEPPEPPLKVALVARMIRPKGIEAAIKAIERVQAMRLPIILNIFGRPDPANPFSIPEELLLQWSTKPGITWHGHSTNVGKIWKEHHLALLLTSYREGMPRSLIEAAAAGRPILTTDVVGCRELVRDGIEGVLVPPGDIDAAARALAQLATDRSMRLRMGAAARARFQAHFSAAVVKRTILRLYGELEVKASNSDNCCNLFG